MGQDLYESIRSMLEEAMGWQFWNKPVPKELSEKLKETLKAQFSLDKQRVDELRILAKKGSYSGRRAELIRIFDPALVEDVKHAQLNYEKFREPGCRSALLFEGRIEKMGDSNRVFLSERRTI